MDEEEKKTKTKQVWFLSILSSVPTHSHTSSRISRYHDITTDGLGRGLVLVGARNLPTTMLPIFSCLFVRTQSFPLFSLLPCFLFLVVTQSRHHTLVLVLPPLLLLL